MLFQEMLFPHLQHGMLALKQNFKEIKAKACYSLQISERKHDLLFFLHAHTHIPIVIVYNTLTHNTGSKELLLLEPAHT